MPKYVDETGLAHFWETIKDKYTEVVADYAGLLESTADLVFVRNMSDGPFGINTSCLFEVTDASTSYIQREDDTYMKACANQSALPPSNAPSIELGDCIASYVGRSSITYGSSNTLFSDTVGTDIDCSAFVHACLYGITYENSRYALGSNADNLLGQYVGSNYLEASTIGNRKHSLVTFNLAEWFAEQKRLFEFPETGDYRDALSMLSFGDILFSSSGTEADRIYGIDHCMIVLKAFDDGSVLVAQAGGVGTPLISNNQSTACKTSIIDFANYYGAGKPFQVFARPCYGGAKDLPQNISAHMKSSGQVTSSAASGTPTLAIINCFQQLQPERAYTLLVKGKLPAYDDMGAWLLGRVGGVNVMRAYHINITSDFVAIPFIMPVGASVGSFMQLMATEDAGTSTGFTYEIEECGIVRGIVDSGNTSRPVNVTKNDSNANVTSLTNFSFIDGLGRFHLALECVVGGTAGTTDENVVGYVQENYPFLNTSQLVKFPVFAGSTVMHVGAYNPSNGAITLTRVQPNSTVLGYTNRINVTLDGIPYNA